MKKNLFITCSMILLLAFSCFFAQAQEATEKKEAPKEEQKAQEEAQKKAEKEQKKAEKEQKKAEKKQKKEEEKKKREEAVQKEAEEQTKGHIYVSVEDWYAKISNVDYDVATKYDANFEESKNLVVRPTSGDSARYRLGWIFKKGLGTIEFNYWGFSNNDELVSSDAGSFTFVENLSFPLFAGALDDGLADGVSSLSHYSARTFSLTFARQLAKSERMTSQWRLGVRKITFNQTLETEYFALVPAFVTPFPPEPSLTPQYDTVRERSLLEAMGIETGLSFLLPISKRVWFSSEVGYSILNGRTDVEYTSYNYLYIRGGSYINPGEVALVSGDAQGILVTSIKDEDVDSNVQIFEANLKLNVRIWRMLDLGIGYAYSMWNGVLMRNQPLLVETLPDYYSQTSRMSRSDVSFDGFFMNLTFTY